MSFIESTEVRNVKGLKGIEEESIKYFLQGAVYCWCKNRKNEWFAFRDLMGGDNYFWAGTPMIALYHKHQDSAGDPVNEAGKDAGWLLKQVLHSGSRVFESKKADMVRHYRWVSGD